MKNKEKRIDRENLELLVAVAKYRYENNLTEKEIAIKIGKTQPDVSKILQLAKEKGLIYTTTQVLTPISQDMGVKLEGKFKHLTKATVIRYRGDNAGLLNELGKFGAREIKAFLKTGNSIALSCGTTIRATLKELKNSMIDIKKIEVFPLLAVMNSKFEEPSSPGGLVFEMADIFPNSVGDIIQFPKPKTSKKCDLKTIKKFYEFQSRDIFECALKANHMVIGIGTIIYEEEVSLSHPSYSFNYLVKELGLADALKKIGGVGECNHQPIALDGKILMDSEELEPLRNHLIYIKLQDLKELIKEGKSTILAIAGGKSKYNAILAALRAKIFNQIVTDIDTAEYLLEN